MAVGGVVLHRQAGAERLVVQAQLDAAGVGVPADIGQRLLRGPVERQPRLGGELVRLAGDRHLAADAAVALELKGQGGQQAGGLQLQGQPRQGMSQDVVQLARQVLAFGECRRSLPAHDLGILAAWAIAALPASLRLFRWEPRAAR